MRNTINISAILIVLSFVLSACGIGVQEPPENPFKGNQPSDSTALAGRDTLSLESFAGLHQQIFSATCANSGCHDGTFEPNFTTISSSYNTLVYQPIIKNDPSGSFTVRVQPGDPAASVLMTRLRTDIDGQSGIMPLAIDPDSDWLARKEEYISAVEAWIQNGAKDMFGNSPVQGNLQPALLGAFGRIPATIDALPREAQTGPIQVPSSVPQVEVWLGLEDESIPQQNFASMELLVSDQVNGFDNPTVLPCQKVAAVTENGLSGEPVMHYHRALINLAPYSSGTTVFFRVKVQEDGQSPVTITPGDGSLAYIKEYFAVVIE